MGKPRDGTRKGKSVHQPTFQERFHEMNYHEGKLLGCSGYKKYRHPSAKVLWSCTGKNCNSYWHKECLLKWGYDHKEIKRMRKLTFKCPKCMKNNS